MQRILLGFALCCAVSGAALAATADDMRALLDQGRPAEAYALGLKHPEELGQPDFDFNYGIAAIDAGHAGEGVLALERYVIQFPDNDRARLELARGYFVLGELVRAREEFDNVSRKNPPPSVQATIDRFMDSIRAQEGRYTTTSSFYLEVGGGVDSNVNSGVTNQVINIPTLGAIQLAQGGVKSRDDFLQIGAGGNISHPIAPGVSLIGGLSYEGKNNEKDVNKQFDLQTLGGYGGFSIVKDRNLWRVTASASSLTVGSARFRDVESLGAEWHRQIDELNTFSLFGQYARLNYQQSPINNSNFSGLGVGWQRNFVARMQPILQLQAVLGKEQNIASPVQNFLSRDLVSLRAGLSFTPAPKWGAYLTLNYTPSRYQDTDPLLGVKRRDDYASLDGGVSYHWTKSASVRLSYLHADNRSNTDLHKYDRDVLTMMVRYEIK